MGDRRDPWRDVMATQRDVLERACAAQLSGRTYRVLLAVLALTACWSKLGDHVSHDQLAKAAGVTDPRNLSRELAALAKAGLIVYRPGSSPAGGKRIPSWVGIAARPPVSPDPLSDPTPGQNGHTTPGQNGHTTPGQIRHRPPVNPDHPPEGFPRNPPDAPAPARTRGPTDEDEGAGLWSKIIEPLPGHVRRRLDQEPPGDRAALRAALAAAERAGVTLRRADVWDQPTALDDPSVQSITKTLRARVQKHTKGAAA